MLLLLDVSNHSGGNIGLVLPVGIVVCRELPRITSFNGFIMQRIIPILSPLVFMPSLYSSFHNCDYVPRTSAYSCDVIVSASRLLATPTSADAEGGPLVTPGCSCQDDGVEFLPLRGSGVMRFVPKECDDVIILRTFDDVQS